MTKVKVGAGFKPAPTKEDTNLKMLCHLCQSEQSRELFENNGHRYVRCRRCGLIARADIESAQAASEYQSDLYQQQQSSHDLERRSAIFRPALDELAALRQPGRLLDVGCGDGLFLKLAADQGWQSHGIELSPMAVQQARRRLGGPDGRIICDEVGQAHFSDGYFDVVTLFNVLDQVTRPMDQLREIHRVLKPGGLLIVRVPNAAFHVTLLRRWSALAPQLVVHLYSFSASTLRAALERAGFGAIRVTNSPLTPGDPYGALPLLGARGMDVIKGTVYAAAQTVAALSGGRVLLGPSLTVRAVKS